MDLRDIQLNEERIRDMLEYANRERQARAAQRSDQSMRRRLGRSIVRLGRQIAGE